MTGETGTCQVCDNLISVSRHANGRTVIRRHAGQEQDTCPGSNRVPKRSATQQEASANAPRAMELRRVPEGKQANRHVVTCGVCGYVETHGGSWIAGRLMGAHQSRFKPGTDMPQCSGARRPPRKVFERSNGDVVGTRVGVAAVSLAALLGVGFWASGDDSPDERATTTSTATDSNDTGTDGVTTSYYSGSVDRPKFNVTFDFLKDEYYPGLATTTKDDMLSAVVSMCNGMTPTTTLTDLEELGETLGVPQDHYRPAILLMDEVCPEYSSQLR